MTNDIQTTQTSLGDLIVALYDEYLEIYRDADLASVAVAATLNELIAEGVEEEGITAEAA